VVTTFYTLVGILSILFSGVALDIITCRPPSPLGKAWLKRFLADIHIVRLNCFPLFLLRQEAQKKKLTKRKCRKGNFAPAGATKAPPLESANF